MLVNKNIYVNSIYTNIESESELIRDNCIKYINELRDITYKLSCEEKYLLISYCDKSEG